MTNMNALPVCPRCHKEIPAAGAVFCPFCGAPVGVKKNDLPEELKKLLAKADKTEDPKKKFAILTEAEQQYPESLEVAEALLFLGRLHERSPRKMDFSVIKCFLWHMYLTPDEFSTEKKDEMRAELISHPQLQKYLSLSPDADLYMRRYLERLGAEFVNLFLKSSNRYTNSFFGIRLNSRMDKVLAAPMCRMLHNIHKDAKLDADMRAMIYDALYRAFLAETGGEPKWLNELLEKEQLPVPLTM